MQKGEPASLAEYGQEISGSKDETSMPEMTGRRVELQSDEKMMTEVKKKRGQKKKVSVIGGWLKDSAPKETHAVTNMTRERRANGKANVLLPPGPRSLKGRQQKWERSLKRKSFERHQPVWKHGPTFVLQVPRKKVHETVLRSLASASMCQAHDA